MIAEKDQQLAISINGDNLLDRVVSILEQARVNVVRAVNNNLVIAYWCIGREIINEIQQGNDRAEYGKQIIDKLSVDLTKRYGRVFSTTNLRYFRTFYHLCRPNWATMKNATRKVTFYPIMCSGKTGRGLEMIHSYSCDYCVRVGLGGENEQTD